MEKLGIGVEGYKLVRYVELEKRRIVGGWIWKSQEEVLGCRGVDENGEPYTFMTEAEARREGWAERRKGDPFEFRIPKDSTIVRLELKFYAFYDEPNISF